ncbi:MAG: tetratricopeptide repeat protein [Gemmatimonadetes bacterium]|nr:tetratricopeptide repeat protein [Gemmatimonadota bacterium]
MSPSGALTVADGARAVAKRILHWLFGPLWPEPREIFERRWQRIFLRGPIGGVVGVWFGTLATMQWGLPPAVFPLLCGLAGVLLMSIAGHIESFVQTRTASPSGNVQVGVAVVADLVIGALLGTMMSIVLEAEAAASLATGAASLAVIHYVASQLLWGDWVERVVSTLTGQAGGQRESDFSYEASLAIQGYVDEALASYEKASLKPGGSPAPLLLGAQLLREERRYEESVLWYRKAFDAPRVDARRATVFVRHIVAICRDDLEDPARAHPHVEALLERYPETRELEWVHTELLLKGTTHT